MNREAARVGEPTRIEGGPIGACPACGGHEFLAVDNGQETNFYCPSCERCWHYSMGWVSRADPVGCPSCPLKDRCAERCAEDALGPVRTRSRGDRSPQGELG